MNLRFKLSKSTVSTRHTSTHQAPKWLLPVLKGTILAVLTLIIYIPSMNGKFVMDDEVMVSNNIVQKETGLYQTWFTTDQPNYWPVTTTALWMQYRLWGLNPAGYHIVNLLIHISIALLIWRVLILLKIPCAYLAALIFAIHPVNVESAAWISQQKNVRERMTNVSNCWNWVPQVSMLPNI